MRMELDGVKAMSDGTLSFSGDILFPSQGVVGTFGVKTCKEYSVHNALYWFGDTEITEWESPAMTYVLDELAYELNYKEYAMYNTGTE